MFADKKNVKIVWNEVSMGKVICMIMAVMCLWGAGVSFAAEKKNYCHDEASWAEWHQLMADNPTDDGVYSLYAMRRGLCGMVEAGTIEQDRATRIFETAREDLAWKWIDENNRRKPNR